MKKLLLLFIAFLTIYAKAQNSFSYNKDTLTEYVVLNFAELKKQDLYTKTKYWLQETYKNPDEVLKADIENEKIRFNGHAGKKICLIEALIEVKCYSTNYTIEISFKDGKMKFEPTSLSYRIPTKYVSGVKTGGYSEELISNKARESMYNKKGRVRIRFNSQPNTVPMTIEKIVNDLITDLVQYIKNPIQDEDW